MRRKMVILSIGVALILLLWAALALAQGGLDLSWWTVDGGGQTEPGGTGYTLSGTIGQPDADGWLGGGYTLSGGFWGGGGVVEYTVYLPLILRNY